MTLNIKQESGLSVSGGTIRLKGQLPQRAHRSDRQAPWVLITSV